MARRVSRKPRDGANAPRNEGGTAAAVATITNAELEAIFASIRAGAAPWSLDELPADTGAAAVLLTELDRLWQNPVP